MAIPNINQITSTLRNMPDQQLQQYAAMNKTNPYILSLAVAESNARKQLRASQQAKMAGQQQPTVADQNLAQMAPQPQLPEEQGIGALDTPNMQNMADGGIAGYGEDSPEQLAYRNEPVMRMAGGGQVQRFNEKGYVREMPTSTFQKFKGMFSPWSEEDTRRMEAEDLAREREPGFFEALTPTERKLREKEVKDIRAGKGSTYTKGSAETLEKIRKTAANDPKEYARVTASEAKNAPVVTTETPAPAKDEKKETALDKVTADSAAAAASARAPAGPAVSSAPSNLGQYTPKTAEELMNTSRMLSADANKESEAAYKPYAEMLQKERTELEGRKEGNVKDALLRAGLAMMAGKSQHALQNIGEGGIQGVNAYQEAKRLDDAAKKALMGSEIAMMQAQRAERSGNHKDAVAIMGQAEQGQQFGINAQMKAQELRQQGEYQRGMVGAANAKMDLMRDAYGIKDKQIIAKYASQAENNLAKQDPMWSSYSDDIKKQKVQSAMRTLLSADPNYAHLASGIGFSAAPNSQLVRTLSKDDE